MSWPNPADYQEAIQYPKLCFADPELKWSTPLTDQWGLPRPISGAFANVYQVERQGQKQAVRCFLRYVPDIERRYALISDYLNKVHLPFTVGFKYLRQGIRVHGQWYPILKMDWVEGDRLDTYIGKHLNDPRTLTDLALKFLKLTSDLDRASIAHGDLQHGNILVVNGALKLIDYDGMYVPGLAGLQSNELGQPNYQHPKRSERDFGLYLDHFSEWVIYLTLVALAVDPGLRSRFVPGNECLLLGREDYLHPGSSALLKLLESERDDSVQALVSQFASFLYSSDLTRIPSLDARLLTQPLPEPVPAPLPSWVAEQVAAGPVMVTLASRPKPAALGDAWVSDHLTSPIAPRANPQAAPRFPPSVPVTISAPPTFERIFLAFSFLLFSLLTLAAATGMLPLVPSALATLGTTLLTIVGLAARYNLLPETRERDALFAQLGYVKDEMARGESRLRDLNEAAEKLEARKTRTVARLEARLRESSQKEIVAVAEVQRRLQSSLREIDVRRQVLNQEEVDEMQRTIKHLQDKALAGLLRQYYISSANLPSLDPQVCQGLVEHGIWTAADIAGVQVWPAASGAARPTVYVQVPRRGAVNVSGINGMSQTEAQKIWLWRSSLERELRLQLPQSLTLTQQTWIKGRYQMKHRLLEHQAERAKQGAAVAEREIQMRYRDERAALAQRLAETPGQLESRRQEQLRRVAEKKKQVLDQQRERARLVHALESYRQVNVREYLRRIF